jgi:metal-responsive CopG/Arc/MetJ family transcriptional regulator
MTQTKVEYTAEEKALFILNNTKVNFWAEKELMKKFDAIAAVKGKGRKDAIIKLMEKFVEKNEHLLPKEEEQNAKAK